MMQTGHADSHDSAMHLVKAADANKDGEISYEEFVVAATEVSVL